MKGDSKNCCNSYNHNQAHKRYYNHEQINEQNIGVGYYLSPVGFIKVVTNDDYVKSISFADFEEGKQIETPAVIDAIKQIDEYFKGKRKVFNLKLLLKGTAFQKNVYKQLLKIPYGKTVSYKNVASMLGDPNSSRAVGNANNKNLILLAIPCHRVTTSRGKLSGASSWIKKQNWLINHEKNN